MEPRSLALQVDSFPTELPIMILEKSSGNRGFALLFVESSFVQEKPGGLARMEREELKYHNLDEARVPFSQVSAMVREDPA